MLWADIYNGDVGSETNERDLMELSDRFHTIYNPRVKAPQVTTDGILPARSIFSPGPRLRDATPQARGWTISGEWLCPLKIIWQGNSLKERSASLGPIVPIMQERPNASANGSEWVKTAF